MQFAFTPEQIEFRQVLRRFFDETSPPKVVRRLMESETGWDVGQWRDMNDKLGLCGVHVPEEYGGQGFGFVELGIVLEEMGRALVCAPYFASTVLATTAILNGASDAQKLALLPPLVAGERVATLAFTEPSGRWDAAGTEAVAAETNGRWRIDGVKSFVLDGAVADLIVVLARAPGSSGEEGLSLFAVKGGATGLTRKPLKSLDPTRRIARLEFVGVDAELLGAPGAAAAPFEKTLAQAATCLANEMVGGAERLRESALDYARLRMQFGRPIASFQSMKHKQADMLLEVELAKSAAYMAAQAAAEDDEEAPALASLAKAAASEAYLQMAIHAIQIHGGIGFTWENDTHLWFKRAKSSEVFLGDPAWRREQMLQAWGH
ncbi:MAG: acyl-CoA dehydrogenase family protein [Caulobacteraceae bacterium]